MLHFKIKSSYSQIDNGEWENLITSDLGNSINSERKKEYIFAREALRIIFDSINRPLRISNLVLKGHHHLEGYPEYTISLTHTKEAGAAVVGLRSEYVSVGIDIENKNRVVKTAIIERISHPCDEKLESIEIWCLKEAIFKCLMNTDQFDRPFEFSEIQIQKKYWNHPPSGLRGEWLLEIKDDLVLAVAFLKR